MSDTQPNVATPGVGWQPIYVKKTRGVGFWVAIGFAIFFFLCTLLLFTLFIGSLVLSKAFVTSATGKKQVAETIVEGSGEDKIAIISIKGILSSESAEGLFIEKPSIVEVVKQQLEQASTDAHVKAVLLEVDSPGGGITGSIGVIMPLINVAELINRYGIKDSSIASGDMKEIGSPLKPMTPEENAILKNIIDEMYMQFINVVSTGRRLDIETVKKIADGRIYTGKQALENGLVDQLGYLEDAISLSKKLAGLTEATIIRYEKHYGLADLFGLISGRLFQNSTIKLDISQLHEQGNTKPMYLWTGSSNGKSCN